MLAPVASVAIPAHDEGRVIGRCLERLLSAAQGVGPLHVVVAANGCGDDTAGVARAFEGVQVLELPAVGKHGALNAADAALGDVFPRIYLDADITMDTAALAAMVEELSVPTPVVCSPQVHFDTADCSLPVRLFYRAFTELPYVQRGLIGLGVYGLSAAGRARFGTFPDLIADDLFVQRLFAPSERIVCAGRFEVRAPRTLPDLVAVRTRVARGNAQLSAQGADEFAGSTRDTVEALARLAVRHPQFAPPAATYVGVTAWARHRARRCRTNAAWERDTSTR